MNTNLPIASGTSSPLDTTAASSTSPSTGATVAYAIAVVLLVCWHIILTCVMANILHMNDFGKFYYATVEFLSGGDLYASTTATWMELEDDFHKNFWDLNPPHFHLLLLPFALLPLPVAFGLWTLMNCAALLVTLTWIRRELQLSLTITQQRMATLGILMFSGTGAHFVTGQLSFVLFLLVTFVWISCRHADWTAAGIALGFAASLKPFLLIFLPYFVVKRQTTPLLYSVAVLTASYAIGLGVFGIDIHLSWLQRLSQVDWQVADMNASLWGFIDRALTNHDIQFSTFHPHPFTRLIWIFGAITIAVLALTAVVSDHSVRSVDRTFAILLLSAILISPLGWIYYLFLPLGPIASLALSWHHRHTVYGWKFSTTLHQTRSWLLLVGCLGLFVPHVVLSNIIGSIYCVSTMMVWGSLILDWRADNPSVPASLKNIIHGGMRNGQGPLRSNGIVMR